MGAILDQMLEASELRHAVVHGALFSYEPQSQTYGFFQIQTDGAENKHKPQKIRRSIREIRATGRQLGTVSRRMTALLASLLQALVRK